ncbi:polysaccharide deacetylase family protein [Polyangium sorediatum]|uniref:Polysaccharide deacetylase family protein n=1 Tax=Polyangium sorediatum TaxID=889274 RepID=A0ABT6P4N5_9BACT|nr:polysaccharide deacetylase family protein [Polyangium sorediatum]MDI1435481.1 polysaccharide deacetylase family protein [Polyangium sorediatum]
MRPASPFPGPLLALRRAVRAARGLFRGGLVLHGPARPEVALTFDDGPSPAHTPAILDILAARRARATFFLLGSAVENAPDLTRRVHAEQEIGCHSYAHDRAAVNDPEAFRVDTEKALDLFDRVVHARPRHYRFPWGNPGRIAPRDVERRFGMVCVHWSGGGFDERSDTPAIVRHIEDALEPGAILLLHDGCAPGSVYAGSREPTVRALPRILDALDARGLRAVTVGELLSA